MHFGPTTYSAASLPLHICITDALNACPPRALYLKSYLKSCGENIAYRSGGDLLYLGMTNAKQYLLSGLMIHNDSQEGRMRGENLSCSYSTRSPRPTDVVIHFAELIKSGSGSEEGLADVGIHRHRKSVLVSVLLDLVRRRACSIQYADSHKARTPATVIFVTVRTHQCLTRSAVHDRYSPRRSSELEL